MRTVIEPGLPGSGTFRAFQVDRGEKLTADVVHRRLEDLSDGDVVIRTAYAGVNYKDALATRDQAKVIRRFPRIIGSDAAGWVVASGNRDFREGEEVAILGRGFGVDHDGGFSQYIRAPGRWLTRLPGGMTPFTAAALGIAGYTAALAVHLLEQAGCQPGRGPILVNGATGAVSSMGIEMLARLGYQVTAVSSKTDQADHLQALGASEVIGMADLADTGKPLEAARWAAALDALGGRQLDVLLRSIMPRGCVASFGNVTGNELATSILPFILRGVRLIGVNVTYYLDMEAELWKRLADDLNPERLLKQVRTIGLEDVPDQLRRMLDGRSTGRTVVDLSA
jgi:putative YhdH/YhfP family quinone oxidoreductase